MSQSLGSIANDAVVDTGENEPTGVLTVINETDDEIAIWAVEGNTLIAIQVNTNFSDTLTTASKINVAFDTDQYKVENKLGSNKIVRFHFVA